NMTEEKLDIKPVVNVVDGKTIIDFGQNIAGWISFIPRGNPGDTIKINFTLTDNDGNPINDTNKSNFKVYYMNATDEGDFNSTVGFSINNESQIVLNQLGVGEYLIKIQFLNSTIGDKNYTESNKTINLNITKTGTRFNATTAKVQIDEDVIIPFTILVDCNKTLNVNASRLNVTVNGIEYGFTNITGGNNVTNGIKLTNFTKSIGTYTIVIKYLGNENCNESEIEFELHIVENNTITANDTIKVNDSNKTITIPFSITNSQIVNVTDEETGENRTVEYITNVTVNENDLVLLLIYDNGTENVTDVINFPNFTLNGTEGNYSLELTVPIDFNNTLYKAQLVIIYANDTLNETNKTINLVAFKELFIVPVGDGDKADYQFGNFTFKLVDANGEAIANENVTISGFYFYQISERGTSLSTSKTLTTDENGIIVFNDTMLSVNIDTIALYYNFTSLPAGTYNATFTTGGFYQLNNKTEITVNPIDARIIAKDLTGEYGNLLHYTFQLFSDKYNQPIKFSDVKFVINASNINADRDGVTNATGWYTSPDLNLTANVYNLTLKTNGDSLNCTDAKATLNVTQRNATLTASNRTIYYNSDYAAVVKLKDKKTGKAVANAYVLITVYTSSKKYTRFIGKTDKNGKLYLTTPLSVGKHKIVYQSVDNNYKSGQITRYLTVKTAPAKFSAPKVSTYYKSGRVFKIKLINTKTKKPIHSGKMNIKLYISKNKYYNYTGVSDAKGFVQFKATLKPGTYKVVVSDYDKGYTAKAVTSQIKVSKSPIKIAPTALKVKKGKYFKVKVTSTKSKKVLSGVKVKVRVYTGKKYKTYTIKTNKKGIASLKIKQKVGKHKVVLTPYQTKYYTAKKVTKTLRVVK
ncbi:family 78 glycoside hydrolase catalytic domain, partial [uncultured Methanobrevibacter sp.]|uniref:family 78 glycoside hydrolase catalytic domain n=1 Tax=uncultured Methanobrevibacter sp. TaxID=253161 RepID=UPI00262ADA5A